MCVPGDPKIQAEIFSGLLSDVPKELQPKSFEKKKNVRAILSGNPNDKAYILDKSLGRYISENNLTQASIAIKTVSFNNFFTVKNGTAKDLGNNRPKGVTSTINPGFVLVIESKSGGNRVSNISVKTISEARQKAKNTAMRNSNARVVILARRVGVLNGSPIFKDIVGFKPTGKSEAQMNFQPSDKMERCIQNVKSVMRKRRPNIKDKDLKSAAIAICRSRLKN